MGGGTGISLTEEAVALGGMKNVRQCVPLVDWAAERVQGGLILDIGAQFGAFCVALLRECPDLTCHAFEPNPAAADALNGMAWRNLVKHRLTIHQLGLADRGGCATLRVPDAGVFSGLATLGNPIRFSGGRAVKVETRRLDTWMAGKGLERIVLIKVDVEGAELLVLRGGERTITQHHPPLILERQAKNTNQFGFKVNEVTDLLASWGYRVEERGRDLFCEWHS